MRILAALLFSLPLWAQTVSLGMRAGAPVTPVLDAEGGRYAATTPFTFGPLVEVRVWRGVGLGADFLFNRAVFAASRATSRRASVWRWELPVTFIYRFHTPARPFVRGGVSLNRVFGFGGATACALGLFGEQFYCLDGVAVAELRHQGTYGPLLGGGLRFPVRGVALEPEIRLTHWVDRNFGVRDSALRSNLTELQLLVGVVF